jgi:hypothetical protein
LQLVPEGVANGGDQLLGGAELACGRVLREDAFSEGLLPLRLVRALSTQKARRHRKVVGGDEHQPP